MTILLLKHEGQTHCQVLLKQSVMLLFQIADSRPSTHSGSPESFPSGSAGGPSKTCPGRAEEGLSCEQAAGYTGSGGRRRYSSGRWAEVWGDPGGRRA